MQHFRIGRSLVDREQFILNACSRRNVLHLGFADAPYTDMRISDGTWLHAKLTNIARCCVGVDIDAESVARLRDIHQITSGIVGNIEKLDSLELDPIFEVVVAGEIIEHINNVGLFLEGAKRIIAPQGRLLITTTNAFCLRRFVRVGFGVESIHPDHVYYFSHVTLHTLARRFGYVLEEAHSYRIPNTKPLLPYVVERLATMISVNWGEGIIHVYRCPGGPVVG